MVKTLYTQTGNGAPVLWCKFAHYTTNWTFPVERVAYEGGTVKVSGYVAGEGRHETVIFSANDDCVKAHKDYIKKLTA